MGTMEDQIVSAIEIACTPTSEQTLRIQATEYCNQLRSDQSAWQAAISIFTRIPRYSDVVRIFVLEIVNTTIQGRTLDIQALNAIKDQILRYLRQLYLAGDDSASETSSIQNKTAQTLTYLFSALYASTWVTCIDDILSLSKKSPNGNRDNASGVIFYLRTINTIHEEIGDQLVPRSRAEQDHANILKDLVRERDAHQIALSWQEVLTQWREGNDTIVELCLKAVGRWVSWIDIGLVVNQQMLDLLFEQLMRAQKTNLRDGEEAIRDAAVDVFTEIIGKKMKAQDKLEMISFLNLETIVSQLIACPPLNEKRFSPQYDTDLAETVARLVNNIVLDIVKILDSETQESGTWQRAENVMQAFLPHVLRFFADEYDEVCSTVIQCLSEVLTYLRKAAKIEGPSPQHTVMLFPILQAIFVKMRHDDTSWGGEGDETDEAEFQYLRQRLGTLQQAVAAVDEQLYLDAVTSLVGQTFDKVGSRGTNVDWRDLDLALCEMLSFGELAIKSGGLYQKNRPNSPAAEKLVQMMLRMVESDIRFFNHPRTQLQYMELCVRYSSFFDKHPQSINPVLQNFLHFVHHPSNHVKAKSWHLFLRFVRHLRYHIGNIAESVIQNLTDLLPIKAEISEEEERDEASSEDHGTTAEAIFNSQLCLFEAVGCICGASSVPVDRQVLYAQSVMSPIFSDMEQHLQIAEGGDERAVLQVHHDVMALGTLARGFSDWTPGSASATPASAPAPEVQGAFARVSEATLVALKSLRKSFTIRTAARFAFSRLVGVLGSRILPQLPGWIEGLLTETSTKDEMALFLRLLDQVIFGFKNEISTILDKLFTPLLQRVFSGLSETPTGTDDEIQLAELKREYLNFLIVILSNDLGSIIISSANQPIFETLIGTIEHFAKDVEDSHTARMAFQVLAKMCSVWGGSDAVGNAERNPAVSSPQPSLPGFDRFMMSRFSPLCWAVPMNPAFNPKDAQARQVLAEAAALQRTIYSKTGQEYLSWLRENELGNMGMNNDVINEYLRNLVDLDQRAFKIFFQTFITKGGTA